MDNALAPFEFHGVTFTAVKGKEKIASCPFGCPDDSKTGQGHFFVNHTNGKFCCKKCTKEGNAYTFLKHFHAYHLKHTKKDHYVELSDLRRIPWQQFKDDGFAYDADNDRWLLPANNPKGSLGNLYAYEWKAKDAKLFGTTGCAQQLGFADEIKAVGPIYICEGQWDAVALRWLFAKCKIDPASYSIVYAPGATTFKNEWVSIFKNREVILLFDNDPTGRTGMDKVQKLLEKTCTVRQVQWPAAVPTKYDIRDFVTERIDDPKRAYRQLHGIIATEQRSTGTKLTRTTFKSVLADFKKVIHVSKTFEDALAVVMAVSISAMTPRDPLWLFLVGPPGVGKTLLIHAFLGMPEKTHFLSKLTKQSLVSGMSAGSDDNGDENDPSVLSQIKNKCLFVEDYTTIKSMPLTVQEELFGLLRSVFNGKYDETFGNFVSRKYEDHWFSMVAGVTDVIHGDDRASLGERFLKIDMVGEDVNEELHLHSALQDVVGKSRDDKKLRDSVAAFLNRPFKSSDLPGVPAWFHNRIVALAALGSRMRASVERRGAELLYRPRHEFGTRLVKQLAKLGRFIAYVLGKPKVDEVVYRLVQKVAFDTVVGFNVEILHALYTNSAGLHIPQLIDKLQLSHTTIDRRLQDLQELRVVCRSSEVRKDAKGRPQYTWHLVPHVRELWKAAEIKYTPPQLSFTHKGVGRSPKKPKKSAPRKKVAKR
jgi:5S rRNA maturation endonuclease (ribonuclease M5)